MNDFDMMRQQFDDQSALQSQMNESHERLYAPQLREQLAEAQAAVIAQTNPAKAIKVVMESFRGNIINENNEIEKVGEPIMNERGIARVATMLIPFLNDPVRFGNISEKEVRDLALKIINDITEEVGIHWREYGIRNSSSKDIIVDSLMTLIFITLTRSEEQGEKNFFSRVVLESIGGGAKRSDKKESRWEKYFKL